METWPPIARRTAALAILAALLLALFSYVLRPLLDVMETRVEALQESRFELARLEARASRDPAPKADRVPRDAYLVARTREEAAAKLQAHLSVFAVDNLVEVSFSQAQLLDNFDTASVKFTATGDERSLRKFVHAIESARPITRMSSWRWSINEGSQSLQLEATAVAAWRLP